MANQNRPKRTSTVVDYDPNWPLIFGEIRNIILVALNGLDITVEHVGSTSIPNLVAKPIIDFNVIIPSRADLAITIKWLEPLGYFHEGNLDVIDREAFGRVDTEVPRDGSGRSWHNHYLYVCPANSVELNRQLLFRDYLRTHPDRAAEYGALKRELATKFTHDIISYTHGKKSFVEEIISLAKQLPAKSDQFQNKKD